MFETSATADRAVLLVGCRFFLTIIPKPIGSMYAIYGHIYHQYIPNVSIYIYIYHTCERHFGSHRPELVAAALLPGGRAQLHPIVRAIYHTWILWERVMQNFDVKPGFGHSLSTFLASTGLGMPGSTQGSYESVGFCGWSPGFFSGITMVNPP